MGPESRTLRVAISLACAGVLVVGALQGAIAPVAARNADRPADATDAARGALPVAQPAGEADVVGSGGGGYVAVAPARLASLAAMEPGTTSIQVAGSAGVPEAGAGVVVLSLAARNARASTWVTVWPSGTTRPETPNLIVDRSRDWTTVALVALGAGGDVSIFNQAARVDLDVDVLGWFPVDAELLPLGPTRVLDTRLNPGRKLDPGATIAVQVAGSAGVPDTGVGGVVLRVTSSNSSEWSSITVSPAGELSPNGPDLVADPSRTRSSVVVVTPGTGGAISVHNQAGRTHVTLDVLGWLPADGAFRPVASATLGDTRVGGTPLAAGDDMDVQVTGVAGVPTMDAHGTSRPYAAVLALYAPSAPNGTSLTAYTTGGDLPPTISLAGAGRQPVVGLAIVKLSDDGAISVHNGGVAATDVVVGLRGWFASPVAAAELVVQPDTIAPDPTEVVSADLTYGDEGVSGGTFVFSPGAFTVISSRARAAAEESAQEAGTIAVGDHVAFPVTEETPQGYLGTVTEVTPISGGQLVVETTQAYLDEVFPEGDISLNLEPSDDTSPPAAMSTPTADRAGILATVEPPPAPPRAINPSPWEQLAEDLAEAPDCTISRGGVTTTLTPHFDFTVGVSWSIWHPSRVPKITALATLGVEAGIELRDLAAECHFSTDSTDPSKDHPLWGPKYKTFWVGWVPVVFEFRLDGSLDLNAGLHFDVGATAQASVTVGIDRNTPVKVAPKPWLDVSPDLSQGWIPNDLRGYAMVDTWLDFSVRLYGVFGPTFSVGLFMEAFVTTDTRSPLFGLDVGAAAQIMLKFKLLRWQFDIGGWQGELPIAEWAGLPPCEYGPGLWGSSDWHWCRAALRDESGVRMRSDGSHREGLVNGTVEDRFRLLSFGSPLPMTVTAPASPVDLVAGTTYPGTRDASRLLRADGFFTDLLHGGDRIVWHVVGGLPPGMTLTSVDDGDAVLSGTPTTAGSYTLVAQAWYGPVPAGATTPPFGPFPASSKQLTIPITVSPAIIPAPVCTDDGGSTSEDSTLQASVVCTDVDSPSLTYSSVDEPANGTLAFNPDGTFSYAPNADFTGIDSFTFKASDGILDSDAATFTITIEPVNDGPTCTDAEGAGVENYLLVSSVSCEDVDWDELTYSLVGAPANGSLTFDTDGTFTYAPTADFTGTDSFTFTASDGILESGVATFTVTVLDAAQSLAIGGPDTAVAGATTGVWATATSGRPVTFTVLTPGICAVARDWGIVGHLALRAQATGTCTVAADQPGGDGWEPAPQVTWDIDVVLADPQLVAWGDATGGQALVPGPIDAVQVAGGGSHVIALLDDGTVVGWGDNQAGQATPPAGLTGVTAVDAGGYWSMALTGDGTVVTWGDVSFGQGDVPGDLDDAVAISAGGTYALALRADGTVVAWGDLQEGKLVPPEGLAGVRAISAGGSHALALLADGTVVAWGDNQSGQTDVPPGLTNVVAVSASNGFSVALRSDGSVEAWGLNDLGQVDVPLGLPPVASIATGSAHTLALLTDGTLATWGQGGYWLDEIPADLNGVVAIGAGDYFSVALTERNAQSIAFDPVRPVAVGQAASVHAVATSGLPVTYASTTPAVCAVDGSTGQLTLDQAGFCELTADQAGDLDWQPAPTAMAIVVVTAPGTVVAWGYNAVGQTNVPGDLTDVVAISAGWAYSLALRADGTVVGWGANDVGQLAVPLGLSDARAVSAGAWHSLALRADGTVVAWGLDDAGQATVPDGLTGVIAVAGGHRHSLALRSDGTVVAWGSNASNQASVPEGLTEVAAIAAGETHSLALRADGTIVAWGGGAYGQGTVPDGLTNVRAIAAGQEHNLALLADGTVVAWGDPSEGKTDVPVGLTGVVAIAAGSGHSLALLADGTVVGWGANSQGQSTPPSTLAGVVAISAGAGHSVALVGGS